ncbi:hypothetical protein DL93DRAFT_2046570, partial [Clavulina sp. PMI_390]
WSKYFYPALWADRVTTRRSTGYSPYYLMYGRPHIFPFDAEHETWYTLEWDKVKSTEDLISLRAKQLAFLDEDRKKGAERTKAARIKSAEAYAEKHKARLAVGDYPKGALVLIYQKLLDIKRKYGRKKHMRRWHGPYRIHDRLPSGSYRLTELDGTTMRGSAPASHLKLFWSRMPNPPQDESTPESGGSDDSD